MNGNVRFFSAGPLTLVAILILIVLVIVLIPLAIFGIIGAAFTKLGFSWIAALALVILMLAGSAVNIPLYRVKRDVLRAVHSGTMEFGSGMSIHSDQPWETLVSLNLGGAVIPVLVSVYLVDKAASLPGTALLAPLGAGVVLVSCAAYFATRIDPGTGIHVPLILPALTALVVAFLVAGGPGVSASVAAFVAGVTGTLIGGNIARINRIKELEVGSVSIGGAGTFASVFVCCIHPALIA